MVSSQLLLLFLLCSSLLTLPTSGTGTLAGLFYNGGKNAASSSKILSFLPSSQIRGPRYTSWGIHQLFPSSRRELSSKVETFVNKDGVTIPTTTPTIITVPATIPTPTTATNNPPVTPLPLPTTIPPTNPAATTPPVTVPGGVGQQPVTNPATTYPVPSTGTVPNPAGTVPPPAGAVPNPAVAPPAVTNPPAGTTNAPGVSGQSWCVAKGSVSVASLQAALDYACGTGGVDCSQIQPGAACYNPNTLQNHASFAFNNYYQKNPVATSCDFGGTAVVVSSNPSSGTCTYPSSSSSSSSPSSSSTSSPPTTTATSPLTPTSPTPSTSTTNPVTTNPTTTTSPSGNGTSGTAVTPPSVLNSSSSSPTAGTANVFGFDNPPGVTTEGPMASDSAALRPLIRCVVLAVCFIAGAVVFYV